MQPRVAEAIEKRRVRLVHAAWPRRESQTTARDFEVVSIALLASKYGTAPSALLSPGPCYPNLHACSEAHLKVHQRAGRIQKSPAGFAAVTIQGH